MFKMTCVQYWTGESGNLMKVALIEILTYGQNNENKD
jgi:hypothetical protein